MQNFDHLLFYRGFLLTNKQNITFRDSIADKNIKNWRKTEIGSYCLYSDAVNPISLSTDGNYTVCVLGLVFNPFKEDTDIKRISDQLLSLKMKSEDKFLDYLDELSGRFLIVTYNSKLTEVYHDASATRTVFYNTAQSDKETVVASHAAIIGDLLNIQPSKYAVDMLTNSDYSGGVKYLPGILSPYDRVKPLTANTKYQVEKKKVKRIFPRRRLPKVKDIYGQIEEIKNVMVKQSELLASMRKLSISLTAGIDSRLTYALFEEVKGDIDYFTHISNTNPDSFNEDVNIAKQLTSLTNRPYKLYEYSIDREQPGIQEFRRVWQKNVGMYRGSLYLFKKYVEEYPEDRLHVRSNIAEIGSVFYKTRSRKLNAKELAKLYTKSKFNENPDVIKLFKEFIEVTDFKKKNFYNYKYHDLFYWEHRMSLWHSWIVLESDVAYETFVPFNNRKLLEKILSIPKDHREDSKLYIEIMKRLNPDLLNYPVNGKPIN